MTPILVGLIALATGEAVDDPFAAMLATIAFGVAFFFVVFPGSRFFVVAFANGLAVYACIFVFFRETNFNDVTGWPVAFGFPLPIVAFLFGTWLRRDQIQHVVTAERVRDERRLWRVFAWLWPVGLIGALSFMLPSLGLDRDGLGIALLVSMGLIALVVLSVSHSVCAFLLDTGLLFEAFFERIEQVFVPAFAFFTFYSLATIVFAALYRIVDRFSATPQFAIDGVRRTIAFPESLYFSLVTVSRVGYGDVIPAGSLIRAIVAAQIVVGVLLLLFGFSEILGYLRERRPPRSRE